MKYDEAKVFTVIDTHGIKHVVEADSYYIHGQPDGRLALSIGWQPAEPSNPRPLGELVAEFQGYSSIVISDKPKPKPKPESITFECSQVSMYKVLEEITTQISAKNETDFVVVQRNGEDLGAPAVKGEKASAKLLTLRISRPEQGAFRFTVPVV